MAFTASFTGQRGKPRVEDIAIGAGSAESQSDTISVNLDITSMSRGEALILLDSIRDAIHAAPFPPA